MIQTGIESKVKIQDIISNQLPEFILDESPKTVDFLKQYYISQEFQGGPVDISDNLDNYLKLDNLKPEVVVDSTTLTSNITISDTTINVSSTRGFPNKYGLLKINDEIITYTGITTNTFTGCIRGFSGITKYNDDLNKENLVFESSTANSHESNSSIQNLSSLFLKEFYKKLKKTFTPGFENISLVDEIDAGNFIKRAKDFYSSKGTDEAIKILFKVIFGEKPSIINLEDYLIKPSSANYVRREVVIAEAVSGEPLRIIGQTIIKSTDENTTASVSSVEAFTRKGKTYFVIELYVSSDGRSSVEGNFIITPNTKLTENAFVGDSILTVDSTISFPTSGNLISGTNTISYTGKSINQFFGCTGINSNIVKSSNIRSEDTYFSYEDGDISKKVEIILLGVVGNLKESSKNFIVNEGDLVGIKNLGDKVENNNSNWKEIFANSFIYNTSASYQVTNNSNIELGSSIDRSSLKVGDEVEVIERGSIPEVIVPTDSSIYIRTITGNALELQNALKSGGSDSIFDSIEKFNVRRKLNKVNKSGSQFSNNSLLSDILNLYTDKDEYAYVASNSLPSSVNDNFKDSNDNPIKNYRLNINTNIKSVTIDNIANLQDLENEVYNTIKIDSDVPFLTGDKIFYSPQSESLVGLVTGTYFVKKISSDKFKLYSSQSLIDLGNNITFQSSPAGIGSHTFTLDSQRDSELGVQKLLRKFPLEKNIEQGSGDITTPGSTGMLINGVEINNYKSNDKIYFGPIEEVNILNGGENYDVINPPIVSVDNPSIGSTAFIQPVISGKFEKIYVDSQDYDIDKIGSIDISGGNGTGAVIEPVLISRPRDILFNARNFSIGGGVDQTGNKIIFLNNHNLVNGQEVVYNSLGNNSIKIGTISNNKNLPDNSTYFVGVVNNKTIKLYFNRSDQQSDTNSVGIFTGTSGTHRFSTLSSAKQLDYIKIINQGEGYTNRKLIVYPSGISTTNNTVTFKNHGFKDGEIVEYDYQTSEISGISTSNQYYVLKIDDNSFRLCDAGIGGTIVSNYERENYIKFNSIGSGEQYFKYPDISVSVKYTTVGFGTTTQVLEDLIVTPVIKGEIIDAYVYETGTGYGSTVLNYEDKPRVTIKNGKSAQLTPIVVDGRITNVTISYSGSEYFSIPDLVVSGSGNGAELRAIVNSIGQISEIKVVNAGIGYSSTDTRVKVVPSGKNALIDPQIRELVINDNVSRFTTGEVLLKGKDKLQYSVSKYFEELRNSFSEDGTLSGIIGWAYDGNPIYGPTGYANPEIPLGLKTLKSGYVIDTSNVINRPSGFEDGFFIDDYKFDDSGDLDKFNGRYEKNNEYPNGVYAYHATLDEFPYFIGNEYRSKLISDYDLDQSFDFNNSNLLRNTLPYKVSEENADYDFINETSDVLEQKIKVLSVSSGSIESIEIQNKGTGYKVGDQLIFDETENSGSGLNVEVKSIEGYDVVDIITNSTLYPNSIFTWKSSEEINISILPNHDLLNSDFVTISGFSTNLTSLNGTHKISVPSYPNGRCISSISAAINPGFTTEIYVAPIPKQISIGSSIGIGTETLRVLGIFENENILRIERGLAGVSHTVGTAVSFIPDSFTISKSLDKFDSKLDEQVFFNPRESVGLSTINGVGYSTSFVFGNISINADIPARSIRIENHPFITNQPVVYASAGTTLNVSTDGTLASEIAIPTNLFVINKNPNLIGLKTAINAEELFFHSNGSDNDNYSLTVNNTKIFGDVEKNVVTVSVSTAHDLQQNDSITLEVKPNLSVGIGTSTAVRVLYKSEIDNIVVNPIGFNSTGINTVTDEITISNHELVTGDKVLYEDDNFEYLIETSDQLDTNPQDTALQSLRFKPDGTKMYILGSGADEVNEYALSTPWSPSTAVFTDNFDVTSEDTGPTGLYIREDGLKFWIVGNQNDTIYQYSMTSAWDLTTASYDNVSLIIGSSNSIDGFTQQINPTGLYFKYDGSVLYLIGSNGDFIFQFNLSTSWDITTASYSGNSTGRLDLNPPDASPQDIHINSSGTLVYFVGAGLDNFYIYKLSTPWNIVTGTELDRVDLGSPSTPSSVYVSPDEENFYAGSSGDDIIRRFIRPSPLTNSEYYVYKINRNRINLCETLIDSQQNPPTVVSFASTGSSSQSISLINPQLQPVKNNNLVFDLSDSSLSGYDFKIYTDSKFKNEFVSSGSTDSFNIIGVGTVGVSTNASLTLQHDSEIPQDLYYNLEKDGVILDSDLEVRNNSLISYNESSYNNTYEVLGVGTTTFDLNINKKPERSFYISTECDVLEYSTTSIGATGPVKSLNILSSGIGYKKLPLLVSTNSDFGSDLIVNTKSDAVGSVKQSKTVNNKFTYSPDKTLRPTAIISPTIKLKNSSTLDQISVIDGGSGYTTPPKVIFVDPESRNVIDSGLIQLNLSGSAVSSADIVVEPKGLSDDSVEVLTIENTNGIAIEKVESIDAVTFKCTISTPAGANAFTIQPFEDGDTVFIEGVQKISNDGDGFNSEDYGFRFLEVTNYDNSGINDTVTISVSGLTTNTGTPKTIQDLSGVIINRKDYPTFQTVQKQSEFLIGEKISSNEIIRDLEVVESNGNELKIFGKYQLSKGEIIRGVKSDSIATIDSLKFNDGTFSVQFSNLRNIGWTNGIGKLNEDYQVIPDNDYYQNLSYSIRSSITYKDQQSPVENLVHVSGLKNFSDTQISKSTNAGIGKSNDGFTIIYDIIDDKRVDTINNFDNVIDEDVVNSKSKLLKLKNRKLTDFIELKNINVLSIDNIDNQFSNFEGGNTEFLSIDEIVNTSYEKYLFRVTSEDRTEYQLTDITILSSENESFIVENESLQNSNLPYGSFELFENEFQEVFLRFNPVEPFNTNYDIKILNQRFNTNVTGTAGTESIGFIDLIGSVVSESEVGIGTTTIFNLVKNNFNSFYVDAQVIDTVTNDLNYVKLYILHDDTNTYLSEYYIDTDLGPFSNNQIGIFTSYFDGGMIKLDHINSSDNPIKIRTNVVGFGTTTSGIGEYRFKSTDQTNGQERSVIYDSNFYSTVSSASTVINILDTTLFDSSKSIVQVSAGATKALHQILMLFDGTDVYTQQSPFLSASTTDTFDYAVGIGTFGGEISGSDILLKFYPDDQNQEIDIEILNTSFYRDLDILNDYNDLSYGSVTQSVDERFYNAINLNRINRTNFNLTVDSIPIFSKTFNPNSVALTSTTGEFNIKNHFFATGEELVYTPNSTIIGIGTSPMQTSSGDLPSTVYAIKITEDKFKVALSTSAALSNNGVTFTSLGEGNAHKLSMKENNTKCIITIDGLVQYPIAFTKISHTLSGNVGGSLGINTTFVSLSGISTVNIQDILYVDDEYMGVVNIGFGNTNTGPITNEGVIALAEVKRGFVGSSATSHSDGSNVRVYKGAFNIVDEQIHFAEPPRGNPQIDKTKSNLDFETSSFTGRVFLKSNYDANKVYDDISDEFTGIGRTFALTVQGSNSVGIGTSGGNGLVFINNIYQSPKTANNPLQFNYLISEDSSAGISTVEFSGIARPDNPLILVSSETDVNLNETPRGGIIVSYGSTPGLGFAPLVGASVTAIVGAGGSITSIGIGTTGTFGSGYNGLVSIGVSIFEAGHSGAAATITATANVGAGGSLTLNIVNGGSGYVDPQIFVSDPSYDNLPIVGVSRIGSSGIAATTDTGIGLLLDLKVGGASTTGIGSTYFEVTEFKISRPGYSFQRGDVFKPVGLVTDSSLSSPLSEFTINVVDTYSDNFAAWEFGELDYIDSISQLQDGVRTRFPLRYNQELLSFEAEEGSALEKNINNLLVIFINGVIQEPVVNFLFDGGTTFAFTRAPLPSDEVEIYFYKGIRNTDSQIFTGILPTIKTGDIVQVISNNSIPDTITQDERVVYNISGSDKIETDRYSGVGIDEINFKPVSWTKQKVSRKVNGEFISKSRDLSEPLIFPTARIIKDVSTTDNEIFVDGVELFNYEAGQFDPNNSEFNDKPSAGFDALIVEDTNPTTSTFTCSIDGNGSVTGITTVNAGSGYLSDQTTIALKFVGTATTTATATASITNGVVTGTTITNPGSGYTVAPTIFAETPNLKIENITGLSIVDGFSGIVTGITTSSGIGTAKAIKFDIIRSSDFTGLSTGYPIYIYDTQVGNGVTSISNSDSDIVGIGRTFVDNIYYISDWSSVQVGLTYVATLTCNVRSDSNLSGIASVGSPTTPIGKYSWGRLSQATRSSNPISIGVSGNIVSGLSSYPTIQRRNFGIRKTGALPKIVS